MNCPEKFRWIIIGTVLLALIVLTVVPAGADENESIRKTPDGLTVPELIYFGDQFRGPGLYRMQYLCGEAHVGNWGYPPWAVSFWLTPAQYDQFCKWKTEDPYMPLSDALSQLVPDQVAALPDEQKESLFNNPGYRTIVSCISVEGTSGYHVPLYSVMDSEYTDEVKVHLANLGLATDYYAVDLTVSAQPPEGVIPGYKGTTDTDRPAAKIVMEGNTPEGTRKSWTFLWKMALCVFSNGNTGETAVLWNVGEDRQADDDEYFMLSALGYMDWLAHPATLATDSPSPRIEVKRPGGSRSSAISTLIGDRTLPGSSAASKLMNRYHVPGDGANTIPLAQPAESYSSVSEVILEAASKDVPLNSATLSDKIPWTLPDGKGNEIRTSADLLSAKRNIEPDIGVIGASPLRLAVYHGISATGPAASLLETRRVSTTS